MFSATPLTALAGIAKLMRFDSPPVDEALSPPFVMPTSSPLLLNKPPPLFPPVIIALCLTKPVTNLMLDMGCGEQITERAYNNIVTSDAFIAYSAGEEGAEGISFLLEELGIPSFVSGLIAPKIAL